MVDPDPRALAAEIQALVRELGAAAPPPRGLPFLGLEQASGSGAHLLDALSTRGIFRKYELVLQLGAGLGGIARWLAGRLGCDVVGTTASVEEALAGSELGRRSGFAAQVRLVPARPDALPVRDARFTHVWAVESLFRFADVGAVLAEAYRALRPGGTVAVQELVAGAGGPVEIAGSRFSPLAAYMQTLAAAGFIELDVRERTGEERSARIVAARAQLLRRLRIGALGSVAAEREAIASALAAGTIRVAQLLARRPA